MVPDDVTSVLRMLLKRLACNCNLKCAVSGN